MFGVSQKLHDIHDFIFNGLIATTITLSSLNPLINALVSSAVITLMIAHYISVRMTSTRISYIRSMLVLMTFF